MKELKIMGLTLPVYFALLAVIIVAIFLNVLPGGMIGAFAFMMIVGALLDVVGNNTPIVKTFFGGGPIVIIFGSAALVYFNILPEVVTKNVDTFMKGGGFLDFYIAALITGSILGMNKKLLIKAAIRYFPCILGGLLVAMGLVSIGGLAFGYTPAEAIAYIGIPIMGGGMGAGAVPIADVFSKGLGLPTEQILSRLVPAVALGNAIAIVFGGILDRVGKKYPKLSGNGKLMEIGQDELKEKVDNEPFALSDFGIGIAIATTFFTFGNIVAFVMKNYVGIDIHSYAWMIISVAIAKAINILPTKYEKSCAKWYQFVASNWTPALLMGIGIAYTDLGQVISAFTPSYLILCFLVVLGAVLGTALVGKLVGFYPIEAAITAGLCMANMGGTGDVAVLTAANRMELMPFAQISSRLGGAFIIFFASIIVPIFFG
ncbi:2-hydroxycarboxylate transporter family protein [Sedimentibacter hydroxybenzoicus DSM 7310]|uniref:2-hydroxycarboxylate transporter family protein n=1 Tax=Sedimentibacter hydroxybenzoicus DSM 7310 TaxID=1123245 RepID=A0A974BIE4_SEDHY|nr:2-hydroxycarboxylate transporter family protein [Sedimentibacter hydroxybenzoicus]NYB73663.1 2-hydroxycarboxylate transporter family protein [Sedimentibacter hydroxybenzoicus DSM 7310]